ncbi:hypothetical protein F8M41_022755 [Gigaspora margarita]|uniref:Uncharacterized protein n=1 Tax=Gigaspora margarita TaxID=4874 RepID=A0A8H4EHS0_GIGMA|nr:hypothetical protein F8M41_022755 [Gigaspora margarita]
MQAKGRLPLRFLNKKSKQLEELILLIIEAKKSNQYVKYGLYLESHARSRGWSDILKEICPNLLLVEAKAYLYNLQFHEDFIENYIISQDTEIPTTIDPKDKMLFRTTQLLLDKIDNVMSKAIRERNDLDNGPIKKPDIFGTYSNKGYNWKLLYGEISNGPFVDSVQVKTHKKLDRIKLGKFAKDSWDNAYRYYVTKH